jgi:OmpA-OmpF porin, OOP family
MMRSLMLKPLVGAVLLLWGATALADHDPFQRDFDAVPHKLTPSLNSGIALESARPLDAQSFRAAIALDLNFGIMALTLGSDKLGNILPFRMGAHLLGSYQLHKRFEIGIDLPFAYNGTNFQIIRDAGLVDQRDPSPVGLGDLRVVPRFFLLYPDKVPIGLALTMDLRFPTGDGFGFLGDASVVAFPRLDAEIGVGPVRVLGNAGIKIRQHGQYLNLFIGNEYYVGGGVIWRLPPFWKFSRVEALGEMHLSTQTTAPFSFSQSDSLKTPWELLVGARARVGSRWGFELDLGRGLGLRSGYGREDLRVIGMLRYDFEFADRDGDGIPDDVDKCPDVPEDKDGFEDSDGCPEEDNDKDGIPDKDDACPNEPGPKEFDGCPDRDLDQVPDNVDKCPDVPGPAENDGCPFEGPLVVVESDRIRLRGSVLFETGSAQIQKQSYKLLDDVYDVLKKHPEIAPIRVEGHTDNVGSRPYNLDLSDRRSKSVVEYLVKRGIDRKVLQFKGFGFDRPVASNDSALNRAKNRRVEFKLIRDSDTAAPAPGTPPAAAPPAAPAPEGTKK